MSNPRRLRQTLTFAGFAALGLVSWLQTSAMTRWLGDRLALNAREIAGPISDVARLGGASRQPQPKNIEANLLSPPATRAPAVEPHARSPLTAINPYAAADCSVTARLAVITAGQDKAASMAVLSTTSSAGASSWQLLREGDTHGDYRVWHIGHDRMWLHGKGESCQIRMYEPAAQAPIRGDQPNPARPTNKGALPAEVAAGIQRLGPNEFKVDRSVVNRVLQNPAELLKVRVVPESLAGSVSGLRLFGIKPGTLLGAIGLQEGDRLDAINGMGLGDAEAMMTALARLRLEKHLVVKVLRAGKEVNLDINVV